MDDTLVPSDTILLEEIPVEVKEPAQIPHVDITFLLVVRVVISNESLDLSAQVKQSLYIDGLILGASHLDLLLNDALIVLLNEVLKEDLVETVKEGLGQGLSSAHRGGGLAWVLTSEDEEVGVALEFLIELRYVNGSSVVKDGIQAL
jgi:hypothetical protein